MRLFSFTYIARKYVVTIYSFSRAVLHNDFVINPNRFFLSTYLAGTFCGIGLTICIAWKPQWALTVGKDYIEWYTTLIQVALGIAFIEWLNTLDKQEMLAQKKRSGQISSTENAEMKETKVGLFCQQVLHAITLCMICIFMMYLVELTGWPPFLVPMPLHSFAA